MACPAAVPPAALLTVKPAGTVSLTSVPSAAVLPLLVATTVAVKVSPVVSGLGALTEIASASTEPMTVVALASAERFAAAPSRLAKCVNTSPSRGICCRLHREGLAAARARSQAAQAPGVGRTRYRCTIGRSDTQITRQQVRQGRRGRRRTGVLVVITTSPDASGCSPAGAVRVIPNSASEVITSRALPVSV